ncbi:MAG TPA: hypothetical protein DCR93_10370 [Cytophagales bacterium]|nr:hypothetical protein [Cytophagales bacterium]HAP59877.1 hypothetical protein [Cytophagales bacterium]
MYTESVRVSLANKIFHLKADGEVILAGTDSTEFIASGVQRYYGVTFRNYTNNNYWVNSAEFYGCKFINLDFVGSSNGFMDMFDGCQLINCDITGGRRFKFEGSIIYGCDLKGVKTLKGSYVDPGSRIQMYCPHDDGVTPAGSVHNNIQGLLATTPAGGNVDEEQYLNFADHRTAFPTFNVNSISEDPKFNRSEVGDFSLQPDSPNIGKGLANGNIGGSNVAKSAFVGVPENTHLVSLTPSQQARLDLLGNNYAIQNGSTEGWIIFAPFRLAEYPAPVKKLSYFGKLAFDAYAANGSANKTNVPDTMLGSRSEGAATPDRLSVQIRWSTGSVEPTESGNYDNQGATLAGNWVDMEINQKPMIDGAGHGTGHSDFSAVSGQIVVATWVQLRVELRNDYTTVV